MSRNPILATCLDCDETEYQPSLRHARKAGWTDLSADPRMDLCWTHVGTCPGCRTAPSLFNSPTTNP